MIDQQEADYLSLERLHTLGETIADLRDEAIKARKESGIEEIWLRCEEAYLGIDDANRHEFAKAKWAKPTSIDGPVTTETNGQSNAQSTAYVRLTSRYVDAGSAKLNEILLPSDDKAFSFEPTPVPDLVAAKELLKNALAGIMKGNQQLPAPTDAQQNPMAQAMQQPQQEAIDQAKQLVAEATDKAKKAEKRIYDWMVECGYRREMRKVNHDAARIGVGILKAPFAEERRSMAVTNPEPGIYAIQMESKIAPSAKWVDPWRIYPDGSCGEYFEDGEHIFEEDFLTKKKLNKLKRQPGYLPEQIDKVIAQGPDYVRGNDDSPNKAPTDKRYRVWYFYGMVSRAELLAAKAKGVDNDPEADPDEQLYAILTLVNDSIIRAVINPLESGDFPYRSFPWSRRAGHWAGVGVAEQLFMPQKMVNAATRGVLNNAGISAGPQVIIDTTAIVPANGRWEIVPNKFWKRAPGADVQDLEAAFISKEFQNVLPQLMPIIEYAMRLAEESTNIPLITQGLSGTTTPETFGAAQLQNNNANQLLRDIGNTVDDHITEPVVRGFYEWLLLDPDVPDDEKGDFQINAHGSAALVEKAIQDQTIQQIGGLVLNPAFGVDPKRWFALMLRTKKLDPRDVQYTDEELQKMAAQGQQPPVPIAVAQINAASREKIAHQQAEVEIIRATKEQDRDTVFAKVEANRDMVNAMSRREELALRRELALLQYANTKQITLEEVKSQLAQTAMKLKTQKDLAVADMAAELHKHHNPGPTMAPPVQLPGRAPNGHSFAQV